ncbi:hypothetical protein ABT270_25705 [Streptomyces sp900105245]|uniref:hypothetical protein n=1 Tax=unclassified Streptomyces TaxID=2593676 RepID=UPI00093A09F0|nr:hypothetical protein [Streptomyces sp. CB01883]OKJ74383.1 hypothetical protein AMK32_35945 [Streptomyces sp. CB01883]
MSDQHAATTLTAAAVVAAILIARTAILHCPGRSRGARMFGPYRRVKDSGIGIRRAAAVALPEEVTSAVREAEQYVHGCWQELQAHTDPPA